MAEIDEQLVFYSALQSPEDLASLSKTVRKCGRAALLHEGMLMMGIEDTQYFDNLTSAKSKSRS